MSSPEITDETESGGSGARSKESAAPGAAAEARARGGEEARSKEEATSEADLAEEKAAAMRHAPSIPRYELLEEVGSGGMSIVYRAIDANLGREVAVKVLHRHLAGRKEERSRFRGEAQAVARLRHPSILEIHDYSGQEAADAYIVSEFIRGPTLRDFAESVGMGLPEVGAMVAERIAAALSHAHAQGVIHRDVKPENVMIQDDGIIKLTDFGIARMVDRDERMTQTGALLGSPAHMPPEIISGEPVDLRADVFSLGTVLYWLACDAMPYPGGSPAEVLRRIVDSQYEDPRSIDPRVSDELAAIIAKAMARRPEERHASALELQRALSDYLAGQGFEKSEDELRSFFADPASYKREQRSRLVELLLARGREAMRRGQLAGAVAAFDRVLAIQPGHEGARDAVEGLRRRSAVRRRLGAGLAGAAALAAAAGLILVAPWGGAASRDEAAGEADSVPSPGESVASTTAPLAEVDIKATGARPLDRDAMEQRRSPSDGEAAGEAEGASSTTRSREPAQPSEASQPRPADPSEPDPGEAEPRGAAQATPVSNPDARAEQPTRPVRILLDTWADISLDGERLERDREARRRLSTGSYRLSVRREGFVPIEEEIEVPPGEEVLELRHRLVPRPALVRVINDQHAAITLNDKLIGPATRDGFELPITFPEQPDGRFEYPVTAEIRIEKPGYLEQVHRLRLRPGQVEEIIARLEPDA